MRQRCSQFETEYSRVRPRLIRYAQVLTRNCEDAEDLLQESLVRMFRYYDKQRQTGSFLGWAKKVVYSTFVNHWRIKKKAILLHLEDLAPQSEDRSWLLETFTGSTPDIAEEYERSQFLCHALEAVRSLGDDMRDLMLDYLTDEYSYQDIADRHKLPVGTVKTRLFRARKKVLQKLQRHLWID